MNIKEIKKGCRYIYRRTGLIVEATQDGQDAEVFVGRIIVGDNNNPDLGKVKNWNFEVFELVCTTHEWVNMTKCYYPFRTCKHCREIESLEQVG